VSCSDQDKGQNLQFEVVGESAALFTINGTSLILASPLDHESQGQINLTLRVTDNGKPPLSVFFSISLFFQYL
jgi:hypothetical protein